MRLQAAFVCLLAPFAAIEPATAQTAPTSTYYILIDASESMASRMEAAETRVQALLTDIQRDAPTAQVSRTYFRADTPTAGACERAVSIAAPVPVAASVAEQQVARGSTPLGQALEAALSVASAGRSHIVIVSDGNQTPSCGVDICAVAAARLPLANVTVTFEPIGTIDAADSDRLGCIGAAQARPVTAAASAPDYPRDTIDQSTWYSRFAQGIWIFTIGLAVASAVFFFRHYSQHAADVERKIRLSENDSASAPAASEEFKTSLWGWALAMGALALSILMWARPCSFLADARDAALRNLNTEFGAAIFLAGSLSAVGSAVSQYWRFFEARREYYVAINRAEFERAKLKRRDQDRMLDAYNRRRETIMQYSYERDLERLASRRGIESSDARLGELASSLVRLAAGTERKFDDVSQDDIERLGKFRSLFVQPTLQRLVAASRDTNSLPSDVAAKLLDFLSPESVGADGGEELNRLLEELRRHEEKAAH